MTMKKILPILFLTVLCLFAATGCFDEPEPETYVIYFDTDGGLDIPSITTDGKSLVELPVPTKAGYEFLYWYITNEYGDTEFREDYLIYSPIESDITIHANWIEKARRVILHSNNGLDQQHFVSGVRGNDTFWFPENFFTKPGYYFSGWNTDPDGSGDFYEDDDSYIMPMGDDDVHFYAVWEPRRTSLELVLYGGSTPYLMIIATYDEVLPSEEIPTKIGYVFKGFYSEENGQGIRYYDEDMESDYIWDELEGIVTIYAYWEEKANNLVLNSNNGENNKALIENIKGGFNVELPVCGFENPGYVFGGWCRDPQGVSTIYQEGSTFTMPIADTDMNLYAIWLPNNYKVEFYANDGTSNSEDQYFLFGQEKALKATFFTKVGYQLSGWSTTPGGEKVYDAEESVKNLTTEQDGIVELYAVWAPNVYQVQFNANNGTAEKDVQIFLYDSTEALKKNSFTRTGYLFAGWSLTESGSKLYDDEELVKNLAAEADAVFMLYAVWTPVKVNVTLDLQSGVSESESLIATYDEVLPELIKPSRMGYIFKGFYSEEDGKGIQYYDEEMNTAYVWQSVEDAVFYAHWEVKANNLVFKINNGESTTSLIENIKGGSTITLPANTFVNTGYTFANWNTKADASGDAYAVGAEFTMPISDTDIELYAVWTANTYQVTLNKSEGTGGNNSAEAIFGEKLPAGGEKPSRNGYRFLGYYAGENGSGKLYYDENMVGVQNWDIAQDTVLYAGWEAIDYQITYNLNQGLNSQNNPLVYNIVEGVPTFYQPTRVGYNFGGWYPNMYFSGAAVTSIPIGSYGDVTLYAKWTPITYRIKFQPNGGEGTMSDQLLNYDQSRSLSKNSFTRYGYVFLGWSTNPFTNYQYVDEATVINLSNVDQSEIILYAIWNPVSVYIMFDADIGVIEGYSGRHYTYGKYIDYLPICKSPHYIFAGWYSTGIEAEVTLNTIVNNINMNMYSYQVTLHPRWIEKDEWSGYTRIYDKAGFESIRNNVYGNYVIMNDINYGGDTIAPFPIFYGNIYGLGHKIYNYTINTYVNEGSINRVGLFGGLAADASIKYLGVQGNIILGQGAYTSNETIWIGGLAAISNGLIYGCYNAGTIDVTASIAVTFDYFIVGGLVGELYLGKVQNSYNSGSVTAYNRGGSGIGSGRTFVGGIIGLIYEGEISGCYNTGDIKGTSNSPSSNDLVYVGGILGYGTSNQNVLKIIIRNCYNKGTITVTSTSQACLVAGGIAGELGGASTVAKLVENCYTVGKIVKDKASKWDNYIFGFISKSSNYTKNNNYCYLDPAGSATESGNSNITVLTNYNDFMTLATILNNGGSTWKNINYNTTILSWQQEAYFLS